LGLAIPVAALAQADLGRTRWILGGEVAAFALVTVGLTVMNSSILSREK